MADFPVGYFEEVREVVAVLPIPQRDEPPGRGDVGHRRVTLVKRVTKLAPDDVQAAVERASGPVGRRV